MTQIELIKQRIKDSIAIKQQLLNNELLICNINALANIIVESIAQGGKIVICGNGGSASDAMHFAGEVVGRFIKERKAYPAVVLNADVATMTAIANDYGYDEVFARQAEGHLKAGDVFVGISTSGNSENVYRAMLKAKEIGALAACLVGKDGGKIGHESDIAIIVPCNTTARVQECHILIIHILCEIIEQMLLVEESAK